MTSTWEGRSIGDRIRYLLEKREMKQTELADKCGITQAAISNIVSAAPGSTRKPSAPTLIAMCDALQANPDWVLSGKGDPFEINVITRKSEKELITIYRRLEPPQQNAVLATAKALLGEK